MVDLSDCMARWRILLKVGEDRKIRHAVVMMMALLMYSERTTNCGALLVARMMKMDVSIDAKKAIRMTAVPSVLVSFHAMVCLCSARCFASRLF